MTKMISKRQTLQQRSSTLMELQVVIAIIVIPAGKFSPTLSRENDKAKQVKYASNLPQF